MDRTERKDSAAGFERAERLRRARALRLSMSERLARVHEMSKQMTAIRGSARKS